MAQTTGQFHNVCFAGVKPSAPAMLQRWIRPVRLAPSPSIFAAPFGRSEPLISPADRLLLQDVFRRLQVNEGAYRPAALARRVASCLRALQVRSPIEALRRLEEDRGALDLAANALLIGVTAFFRDPAAFSYLQAAVIPELLQMSPAPRVLSVACSDGSEAYSLAILLLEAGVKDFSICGIDCRRPAIQQARAGVYPAPWLEHLSAELRGRYFDADASGYRVRADVRARVQFQQGDAFVHVFNAPYDLVACRNFAIYLGHPAAARLWRRLHRSLRPDGFLLTGKAERPTSGFLRAGPCFFRKAQP